MAFSTAAGPDGRVITFEPQSFVSKILSANMLINWMLNVEVHRAVLAHAAGMTSLQRMVPDSSAGFGEASLRQAAAQGSTVNFGGVGVGSGGEAVPCWALDDFALVNVSLLKIDAEGAEQLVAFGLQRTIHDNLPVVVFERRTDKQVSGDMLSALPALTEDALRFDLLTFCQSLGYTLAPALAGVDMGANWVLLPPA